MYFGNYLSKDLLNKAVSLQPIGLNEISWDKQSVLDVIRSLQPVHVGILGGDVYRLTGDKIISLPDSWYCEKEDWESDEAFFERSKLVAIKYIDNFPVIEGKRFLFSLVLTD